MRAPAFDVLVYNKTSSPVTNQALFVLRSVGEVPSMPTNHGALVFSTKAGQSNWNGIVPSLPLNWCKVSNNLVVAMTSVHMREIAQMAPETMGKVLLLKALPEMAAGSQGLDGLLAAPRPPARRALDVDDPIGLPITAYERCAAELEAAVEALAKALCNSATGGQDVSAEDAETEPEGETPE